MSSGKDRIGVYKLFMNQPSAELISYLKKKSPVQLQQKKGGRRKKKLTLVTCAKLFKEWEGNETYIVCAV